jgi:hypothetical protein
MKSVLPSVFSGLSIRTILRAALLRPSTELSAAEASSTIYRFFRSKHVVDLKVFAMIAMTVGAGAFLVLAMEAGFYLLAVFHLSPLPDLKEVVDGLQKDAGKVIGLTGVILVWAYRSACTRLGVVDLFACEIGTLCRVGTLFGIGRKYVAQYEAGPPISKSADKGAAPDAGFVSQEEYFPVFENNTHDLQLLEATVVNNITEFYTYMKATRDALRRLGEISPEAWHGAMCNVIYLVFLAYESGRKAINDLVEYEPVAAESKIVILLTELDTYAFLIRHFPADDLRYKRLKLREPDYRLDVSALYETVSHYNGAAQGRDWLPAVRSLEELAERYQDALGESIKRPERPTEAMTPSRAPAIAA